MTQQADPFDAMSRSFNALQGAWDQGTRNQAGRAYASGDLGAATNALAAGGMIQEAGAVRTQAQTDEQRERGTQIAGALRGKDYAGARQFAQTPEELAAVETFASNATKAERDAAAARAGNMAAIATAVMQLPAEQQRAAVMQYAQQFGVDPAGLPEQITPEWVEGIRVQALGLEEYLKYKDREADNQRQQDPSLPAGYRWTAGGALEAIPGGPADPRVVSTRAAAGRAPPRPRASGGSSSRPSSGARPPAPAGRPWERSW